MQPGPQFQQLAMFHTADELVHRHIAGDRSGYASDHQMWSEKLAETRGAEYEHLGKGGLHGAIDRAGGVEDPVHVFLHGSRQPELLDGHHRVAVAMARSPKSLVPVKHSGR